MESKIPSISGLATSSVLTTVENKVPYVSKLVKRQIRLQKCQTLKINMLLQLITINVLKILLLIA